VGARYCALDGPVLARQVAEVSVVVNTLPADVAAGYAAALAPTPVLLEVIYDPWPTRCRRGGRAGGTVISGCRCCCIRLLRSRTIHRATCSAAQMAATLS